MRLILGLSLIVIGGFVQHESPSYAQSPHAAIIPLNSIIHPISERYVSRALAHAVEEDASVAVIVIDTPGGLLSSTRKMVTAIFDSPIPVIAYVAPNGARASSAGTFITMAAHIAAMDDGTNIGAASPIAADGNELSETVKQKAFQDTAAEIRAIAEYRQRPIAPLESTVTHGTAYTAREALSIGMIDLIADDLSSLLNEVHGTVVIVKSRNGDRQITLETDGLPLRYIRNGFFDRLLSLVANPDISFLLISLGGLGIYLELMAPGTIFPGIFGLIALSLGFLGLGNLPGNWAGAGLILVGFLLLVGEGTVDGFGALGIMGALSFLIGATTLFSHFGTPEPGFPDVSLNRFVLIPTTVAVGGLGLLLAFGSISNRRKIRNPPYPGSFLVGKIGVVSASLTPHGSVTIRGELWNAWSGSGTHLVPGTRVRVTEEIGPWLTVVTAERNMDGC